MDTGIATDPVALAGAAQGKQASRATRAIRATITSRPRFRRGLIATALCSASIVVGAAQAGAPAAVVAAGYPGAGSTIADGAVILAWTADGVSLPLAELGRDKDFLAVIDAEAYSSTYGKVIWTAELPNWLAAGIPGGLALESAAHNDPHHMLSYTSYTDPNTRRKYTLAGGVISKNVFRFDITSLRDIPKADFAVCGTQPTQSSLTDDFLVLPSGNIMFTYMSSFGYTGNELGAGTPSGGGTLTEIDPMRKAGTLLGTGLPVCQPFLLGGSSENKNAGPNRYLGEYQLAPKSGPLANVSRRAPLHADTQPNRALGANKGTFFFGNTNASREALPHGMNLSYDGKYIVAADYAVALSIGAAGVNQANFLLDNSAKNTFSTFGVAVRVSRINPATLDPVPSYGPKPVNGYADPDTITYGGAEAPLYALDGRPTDDPATYMESISVVPDGPRRERIAFHEESEGLMPFAMFHQSYHCPDQAGWNPGPDNQFGTADDPLGDRICPGQEIPHSGSSANSMCGGTMFYTANVRLPQSANNGAGPIWHAVYDVGPCSGVSYHHISHDDRFVVQPIAGIETNSARGIQLAPNDFDRDYPRQHSRRMITMDVRPLLAKGNGISADCNGDGEANEEDLACGATFNDPIACHFPGEATRTRANGTAEINSALGLPINTPGDGGLIKTAVAYATQTGTPAAAGFNRLVHNNRANDCPRVVGAVGQFETGPNPAEVGTSGMTPGLITASTGNEGAFPGKAYTQFAGLVAFGGVHNDTDVGGAPTLTNLNTAQNMNTRGGPHFTFGDRIGFCLPTGASGGVATCKAGSYYDLRPDAGQDGAPLSIYPGSTSALTNCAAGTSGYKGSASASPGSIDPSCVERVLFLQYFVELNHVPAPGTGSDGDRTMCMMLVNRVTGATMMDPQFVDELTKQPCLDFDGAHRERKTFGLLGKDTCPVQGNSIAGNYCWPGARGGKGVAKPHSAAFERDGANLTGPGYFPPVSINPDGNR